MSVIADRPDKKARYRAWHAEWRKRNHDILNEKQRIWYRNHKEQICAKARAYRTTLSQEQRERLKEHNRNGSRKYRKSHKDTVQKRIKDWMNRHPGIRRVYNQRRRALLRNSQVNNRNIQNWMSDVLSRPFATCYYCDQRISTDCIHFDHIVPLFRGGPHRIENLCVACPTCNLTKSFANLDDWEKPGQQVLSL